MIHPKHFQKKPRREIGKRSIIAKALNNTFSAVTAIELHSEGKRGVTGELPCPNCKTGTLKYSIARSNGHIHAACTTPKCTSFMQ